MNASFAGKPRWLKVRAPLSPDYLKVRAVLKQHALHTVCESASCPNLGQCWHEGSAAFMILGDVCTRRCTFCAVTTGRPAPIDAHEPERLAQAAKVMGLRHVVITSVSRDDLADGGAAQFVACIESLRRIMPTITVEVLTPDFLGKPDGLSGILAARPQVFNHNVETVPRLYSAVRPAANYLYSLDVLARAAAKSEATMAIKSGMMLGLGEDRAEVLEVLADLRHAGVELLTIGQYLRPGLQHHPVVRYWHPDEFAALGEDARRLGFRRVACHPLARSSFHAEHLVHMPLSASSL